MVEYVFRKQRILNEETIPDLCKAIGADTVKVTFAEGKESQTSSQPQYTSTGSDGIITNRSQLFVKNPSGKSTLIWAHATDNVTDLKHNIANHIGYPDSQQHLLTGGRTLQDYRTLKDYNIMPRSTTILNMRLRGGAATNKQT